MKIKKVVNNTDLGNYFINSGYLHRDGMVWASARNEKTGQLTGYFETKEEAVKVLEEWEKKELKRLKRKYSRKKKGVSGGRTKTRELP